MTNAADPSTPGAALGQRLTHPRLLSINVGWNLVAQALPLIAALASVPILLHVYGVGGVAVITLSWTLVGFAGIFDLGIGRALTQTVAQRLSEPGSDDIGPLIRTASLLMLLVGVIGAAVTAATSHYLVYSVLQVDTAMRSSAMFAMYVTAILVPVATISSAWRGVIEAHQRFSVSASIRTPVGVGSYLGAALVATLGFNLDAAIVAVGLVRLLGLVGFAVAVYTQVPTVTHSDGWAGSRFFSVMRYGGWVTVSNIISPLLTYIDRFVVGAAVSLDAVAYYGTPSDVINRLAIIPSSVAGVLFPAFATAKSGARDRAEVLFSNGMALLFALLMLGATGLCMLAPEGMSFWLGARFATQAAPLLQVLAVGLALNGLAYLPQAILEGYGRPKITAIIHTVEVPLYLPVLWWALHAFGLIGAAWMWTARVGADLLVLSAITAWLVPETRLTLSRFAVSVPIVTASLFVMAFSASLTNRALEAIPMATGTVVLSWLYLLSAEDRSRWSRLLIPGRRAGWTLDTGHDRVS